MPLTKEETLQQEYFVLEKQDNELQEKIFGLKRKKQDIECEIESLTADIKLLEKQKVEKSWKITCLNIITFGFFKYYKNKKINNQIKRKQGASETLTKQIAENTKIKHSFKNKKLKVATEMINILQSLLSNSKEKLNNLQNKFWQEISQKLDMLLEHQIDHAKSSSSLEQDSSGYNSDDDNHIEVIPEPKENKDDDFDKYKHIYEEIKYDKNKDDKNKDDILTSIIKKHTPLLRYDSKDSGVGSESEQPIFNQSLIEGLDDILEKYFSVGFTNKI